MHTHHPDGFTRATIDALIRDLTNPDTAHEPCPTTAFLDGTARDRRERREANRALAAVVRALPRRTSASLPVGEVA